MPYVVDEVKRCGLPARPTLRRARRKARKHLPPTANPALTTMHSSMLANDFSFCPTLASASFQLLFSRCSRCLPTKPRVLILLRTLFLSLPSFQRSTRLFSIICGLFAQNTGGVGYLWDISALSVIICLVFVAPLFSWSYKLLFPQPLYFDNHLRCPPGVGSALLSELCVLCALCGKSGSAIFLFRNRVLSCSPARGIC